MCLSCLFPQKRASRLDELTPVFPSSLCSSGQVADTSQFILSQYQRPDEGRDLLKFIFFFTSQKPSAWLIRIVA